MQMPFCVQKKNIFFSKNKKGIHSALIRIVFPSGIFLFISILNLSIHVWLFQYQFEGLTFKLFSFSIFWFFLSKKNPFSRKNSIPMWYRSFWLFSDFIFSGIWFSVSNSFVLNYSLNICIWHFRFYFHEILQTMIMNDYFSMFRYFTITFFK